MTASTVSNALPEESNTAIPSTGATHFSQTDAPTPSLHGCGSPSSIVAFLLFALPNPASDVSTLMRPRAAKLSANGSAGEMRRTTALLLFTMPALLCTMTWYALPSSRATLIKFKIDPVAPGSTSPLRVHWYCRFEPVAPTDSTTVTPGNTSWLNGC